MTAGAHRYFLWSPGARPHFGQVCDAVWGAACDVDTDGNADTSADTFTWTELDAALRPAQQEQFSIYPLDEIEPLVLVIESGIEGLARKAANFLHQASGGSLSRNAPENRTLFDGQT